MRQRFSKFPQQSYPYISLMIFSLFICLWDEAKAVEVAYYVQSGYDKTDGLYPVEVWYPGTGYSSLEEARSVLLALARQKCQDHTFDRFGATCAVTYIWESTFDVGNFPLSIPPGSEVTGGRIITIGVPYRMSCTDGFEMVYVGCGGTIFSKYHNPNCPIAPLRPLPDDSCTQSLEAGRGEDKIGACTAGLTPEMQQQAQCLADKITSLGIPYPGPTGTVRTPAYQAHLREIWEKLRKLNKLEDPAVRQACASRKAEIEAHKRSHGLKSEPAASSRHELGKAVDIGEDIIRELINRVTTDMSDVQDYVNSPYANPPACNLQWGGRFRKDYDPFHFQLP